MQAAQSVSNGAAEPPPPPPSPQAGLQNLKTVKEEGTNLESTARRPDVSLQIPRRPVGFGSSRTGKGLLQSQGSSKGSSLSGGLFWGLSFKKKGNQPNGERSSLLDSDPSRALESPIMANPVSPFSWERWTSLPVTPAPNLSHSVATPSSARMCNEVHKPHVSGHAFCSFP